MDKSRKRFYLNFPWFIYLFEDPMTPNLYEKHCEQLQIYLYHLRNANYISQTILVFKQ